MTLDSRRRRFALDAGAHRRTDRVDVGVGPDLGRGVVLLDRRKTGRDDLGLLVAEVVEMDVLIEDGDIIAFRTKLRLSYKG